MEKEKKGARYRKLYEHFRRYLKNLLRNYFIWELPETIDSRAHEEMLLFNGFDVGFKCIEVLDEGYKNKPIVSTGALAGIDLYQRAVRFVSANPRIQPTVIRTVGVDCVPCYNTLNYQYGENCNTLVDIYADLLANVTISMRSSVRNSRVCLVPTVSDTDEAIRVGNLLDQLYDGDSYALAFEIGDIAGNNLFPIKAKDNIVVSELADARRSILADFFSETGVKTIAVDKRERVNLAEMDSNSDQIKIACDIMLAPRKRWAREMNKMFNTNISVKFNEEVVKNELRPENEKSMESSGDDRES